MTRTRHATALIVAPAALGLALAGAPCVAALADDGVTASPETEAALSDAQAQADEAQKRIDELNASYFQAQGAYDQVSEQLRQTEQQIADLQSSIDDQQSQLDQAQDTLARRISANYQTGLEGALDLILSATDFDDLVTRVYYAGKVSDSDAQLIQQIKDLKASLESDRAQLEDQRGVQVELQAQQKQALTALEAQLAQARQYKAGLDQQVSALLAKRQAELDAAAAAKAARSGVTGTALSYLGSPYVWGAEGPSTFDCSGLTTVAYRAIGVEIPHQSGAQYDVVTSAGNLTDASGLVPGDLVFFGYFGTEGVCHVGIYLGDGMIVHALPTSGVATESLSSVSSYLNFLGGGSPT